MRGEGRKRRPGRPWWAARWAAALAVGGEVGWAISAAGLKARGGSKRKEKAFPISIFAKQLQIQTKFEFRPLNSSSVVKQRIVLQHECNKNVSKPYISFQ
jgi:hypothetical protein